MNRYHQLSVYFRHRFRQRVQKVPLDAGFTCPNRDGSLSTRGCIFCNPRGSGSGMGLKGASLSDQWAFWRERYSRSLGPATFIAYLQSFSNTYGPLEKLEQTLTEIEALPDLAGLSIGTRPDCIDNERLDLIARTAAKPAMREVWLELGLQSALDRTLARINRGHDFASFERAVHLAHKRGLKVCAHVIAGLPGESLDDFLYTIDTVNALPVQGIKFHSLYVAEDTPLAEEWQRGEYTPLNEAIYIDTVAEAIPRLRPEIVIQRLTGDPAEGELLAPVWPSTKTVIISAIAAELQKRDTWQGKALKDSGKGRPPLWFSLRRNLPAALHAEWEQEFRAIAPQLHFDLTEPLP
ncbi:TIGR01212 family radical SAM protein [Desulfovibrio mangrovi]|uniref:TIGR01212 family radical SAM protein n=1 Tax=Desulfovibrio mangrovi TaxID=2976983 RepID=UPI0022477C83|nr:TIGR01212 family radical SAM protein [Desulfovibrio mangrovi]UZP69093.1 TIGR01212 family radical SAM protein [Desulfovibrio mangrovi]